MAISWGYCELTSACTSIIWDFRWVLTKSESCPSGICEEEKGGLAGSGRVS